MGKSASAEKPKGSLNSAKAFSRCGSSLILGSISAEASITFWPFSLLIVVKEKKNSKRVLRYLPIYVLICMRNLKERGTEHSLDVLLLTGHRSHSQRAPSEGGVTSLRPGNAPK